MSYLRACGEEYQRELSYKIYVTDSLQAAVQNKYLPVRWIDIVERRQDNRTGDEIAADVIKGAGLRLKDDGND